MCFKALHHPLNGPLLGFLAPVRDRQSTCREDEHVVQYVGGREEALVICQSRREEAGKVTLNGRAARVQACLRTKAIATPDACLPMPLPGCHGLQDNGGPSRPVLLETGQHLGAPLGFKELVDC